MPDVSWRRHPVDGGRVLGNGRPGQRDHLHRLPHSVRRARSAREAVTCPGWSTPRPRTGGHLRDPASRYLRPGKSVVVTEDLPLASRLDCRCGSRPEV
jgi:hypothetical protein